MGAGDKTRLSSMRWKLFLSQWKAVPACRASIVCVALAWGLSWGIPGQARAVPGADRNPTTGFSQPTLNAAGRNETLVSVSEPGRWSIRARSREGVALRLVDRLSGPGSVNGEPGKSDGRLDLFLERGEYKLITLGHEKSRGKVELSIKPFKAAGRRPGHLLVEHKLVETTLTDLQKRSWWLKIKKRRTVHLEAAGRSLADLRIWKPGNDLVDTPLQMEPMEASAGRPMNVIRISRDLNPGLYRLTAYGGAKLPWSTDEDQHPLYLRAGIPELNAAGSMAAKASPFGRDRWIASGNMDYFRLELPESKPATLRAGTLNPSAPFSASGSEARITKRSRHASAEITDYSNSVGKKLITVDHEPGGAYRLYWFTRGETHTFRKTGRYWISTIHGGDARDMSDTTTVLLKQDPKGKYFLEDASMIRLDNHNGWRRSFNLQGPLTLFLEVAEHGRFFIGGTGPSARFRVEPYLTARPPNAPPPKDRDSGYGWELSTGYYLLNVIPFKGNRGIMDLSIRPQNLESIPTAPAKTTGRLAEVFLDSKNSYTLYMNHQTGLASGMVLRSLPVNLSTSFPLTLRPNEELTLPVMLPKKGKIRAVPVGNAAPELFITAGEPADPAMLDPSRINVLDGRTLVTRGTHTLFIRNPLNSPLALTLDYTPERLLKRVPLPFLPKPAFHSPAALPVLGDEEERFFNLARKEKKSFVVKVDAPALYRLESLGLLSTEGKLGTSLIPSLASNAEGGPGRNFMLQQYLKAGEYRLTVGSLGRTMGRLGLRLQKSPLASQGELTAGSPSRHLLKSGKGALYTFHIPEEGKYRVQAMGLGRNFPVRLEDEGGWPLLKPGNPGDLAMTFPAGTYRLIVLPGSVDARLVTLLSRVPEEVDFIGKGPHRLGFARMGKKISHTWMEPAGKGGPRLPDLWEFVATAPVTTTIELGTGMEGALLRLDGAGHQKAVGAIPPGKPWKERLEAGTYRVAVKSVRKNNRFDYFVRISLGELLPGNHLNIEAPSDIFLSTGRSGPVDIYSMGKNDVRASLYAPGGRLIAKSDDRDSDWNFLISEPLKTGRYRLRVEPAGNTGGATTVYMTRPEKEVHPPLSAPARMTLEGDRVHVFPAAPGKTGMPLLVSATSPGNVSITLFEEKDGVGRELASARGKTPLLAFTSPGRGSVPETPTVDSAPNSHPAAGSVERSNGSTPHSLIIRPLDGRKNQIRLVTYSPAVDFQNEDDLTGDGVNLEATGSFASPGNAGTRGEMEEVDLPGFFARIRITNPGIFQLDDREDREIYWASEKSGVFRKTVNKIIPATGETLWLMLPENGGPVRARRISAGSAKVALTVSSGRYFMDIAGNPAGPLLVMAESSMGQPGITLLDPPSGISGEINRHAANPETGPASGEETAPGGENTPPTAVQAPVSSTPGSNPWESVSDTPDQRYGITGSRLSNMATGKNTAVSVSLSPGSATAALWNGENQAKHMPITVQRHAFEKPSTETCDWGLTNLSLNPGGSRELLLPVGPKNLRMVLPAGTAAVLGNGNGIEGVHWSGNDSMVKTVRTAGNRLTLLHTEKETSTAALRVTPAAGDEGPFTLESGKFFRHRFSTSGVFDLEVKVPAGVSPVFLNISGNINDRVFVDRSGKIDHSPILSPERNGTLTIRHNPGLLVAWMAGENSNPLKSAESLTVNTSRPNELAMDKNGIACGFRTDQPLMVHMSTDIPVLTRLSAGQRDSKAERAGSVGINKYPGGANLTFYLPPNRGTSPAVTLAPMDEDLSTGNISVHFSGITAIDEGMGPKTALGPGDSRLFSFMVKSDGTVGIGVNGPRDAATCRLWNEAGELLGEGPVQMHDLVPGKYMLSLDNPPESMPLTVRPVVVGIEPPGTGPPREEIKKFIEQ